MSKVIIPMLMKIIADPNFKYNLGIFLAIIAPKKTPIHAKQVKARKEPSHTSRGEE